MTSPSKSIVVISKESIVATSIEAALKTVPNVTVEEYSATLSEMNGSAVTLANRNDVVIFRTESTTDNDIRAISELRTKLGAKAIVLALSGGATSLADVRRLTEAGVNEILLDSIPPEELKRQILRWSNPPMVLQNITNSAASGVNGKIITVAQARGGVGSTSVAVNLADALLARTGKFKKLAQHSVLVVDLDIQSGAVGSLLDVEPSEALYQMAMDGIEPDALFLGQAIKKLPSGLSVLPAPNRFAPLEALQKTQISKMLDLLTVEYDYVVIDLPRTLVEWIVPVLERSDSLLMVTDMTVPSIRQARRLIDFYTEDNLNLEIEVVVNHEAKPLIMRRHHAEAKNALGRPFQHWIPHDPKVAREAVDRGVPFSQVARRSALNKSITRLGAVLNTRFKTQSDTRKPLN